MPFENLELRFRRNSAFAHTSTVTSDKTRPVKAAVPSQNSFGSESFAGDYGLNPLFNTHANTVNIEAQEPKCNTFRQQFVVLEFNPRIKTQTASSVAFN
jgi:hypothetical protein